jgi:uncharacterized protein (TIGR02270 family)
MPPVQSPTEPFLDLVDESLDEAAFLWGQWERELTSLTRNLDEVWSWTEDRLHGALDGVRVAGAGMIDVAAKGLKSDEPDRIAVSAGVLASSGEPAANDVMAAALRAAEDDKLRAMLRGLELLGSDQALRAAASVLAARGPACTGALCRVKAFRRAALGEELAAALKSDAPGTRADALRAVVYVPSPVVDEWIVAALRSDDALVRSAAVESGVGRGIAPALDAAARLATARGPDAGGYLKLLAMLGTAGQQEIVHTALRVPELQLPAIWALGHIGTVRAAESCLAGMQHEKLARASGEAYCWITGADLVRDHLEKKETPPDVPPFEEDDLNANLVPPQEALWPLPDPEAVRQHWVARRAGFAADARHIHGRPVTVTTIATMIETGPMLRRPDLVLELRARTRGKYDVEPRAFTVRQRHMMETARAALAGREGR